MVLNDNPLYRHSGLPLFDKIKTEHFKPAILQTIEDAEAVLARIESTARPTWDEVMKPLETISGWFQAAAEPLFHLLDVRNSNELREIEQEVRPLLVKFGLKTSQNRVLFRLLNEIKNGTEWRALSEAQQRAIELRIRSAELSGIALEGKAHERFNEIQERMSVCSSKFRDNTLDSRKQFQMVLRSKEEIAGLPDTWLGFASELFNQRFPAEVGCAANGPWLVTLDVPSMIPFLKFANRRDLREKIMKANALVASEGPCSNDEIVREILALSHENAQLLGYASYAEVSLASKMAPNPAAVYKMYEEIGSATKSAALADLQRLRGLAERNGVNGSLEAWDTAYWSEKLAIEELDYDEEKLRAYFPLETVLDGLFGLCNRLFGIRFERADGSVPVWHPDVQFLKIYNDKNEHQASLYLDLFARSVDKRGGAWMNNCMTLKRDNGKIVELPCAYIACNAMPPVGSQPSLQSFDDVTTLFHEMGHALQHLLTGVEVADVSGINGVEWDAVELASQFMENWCYEPKTLEKISKHWQSGEALPQSEIAKIIKNKKFLMGLFVQRQILFGYTDFELYHKYANHPEVSPHDVLKKTAREVTVAPFWEGSRMLNSFGHIFGGGYAAGYYSYLWAEMLSCDAFMAFVEAGLNNEVEVQALGRKYASTILHFGGGRHPMNVFRDFRGREPTAAAYLKLNLD